MIALKFSNAEFGTAIGREEEVTLHGLFQVALLGQFGKVNNVQSLPENPEQLNLNANLEAISPPNSTNMQSSAPIVVAESVPIASRSLPAASVSCATQKVTITSDGKTRIRPISLQRFVFV